MDGPFQKRNKYHAEKITTEGYSFASKLEASTFQIIKLREKAKELKLVQVQATVYLTPARIKYVPDFKCIDLRTGEDLYIEAKGYEGERWGIIKKLWAFYGPGKLEVWKGNHLKPFLDEVILCVR